MELTTHQRNPIKEPCFNDTLLVYYIYPSPVYLFLSFLRSSQETATQTMKLSPSSIVLCSAATSASTRGVGSTTSPCVWRSWAATRSRGPELSNATQKHFSSVMYPGFILEFEKFILLCRALIKLYITCSCLYQRSYFFLWPQLCLHFHLFHSTLFGQKKCY